MRPQPTPLQPLLSNTPTGIETPSPLSRTWSGESFRTVVDPAVFYGDTPPHWRFSCDTQAEFNADLCRLLVVCNIAWWAVENPYWRGFFNKWLPMALIPGRKELSTRILDEEVAKVIDKMKPNVQNRYATGECDGWKNVTKASIIAFIMNVEYIPYLLNIADISALHKTAENLLELVIAEIKYATEVLKIIVVAWCTDASGESAKMRRLLNVRMPHIITLDCWCHQINLIVGDIFKVKNVFVRCMEGAIKVIKWFNNHSRALGKLKDVQRQKFQKIWCLILPVLTRWTSHYLAIRRLLELEIAFKQLLLDDKDDVLLCAGDKREAKEKAEEVIGILEGYNFWGNLRYIKAHLKPLAVAANVTQSDNARLDVIVITLVNLYRIFSDETRHFDESISQAVLASLEKRWAKADRPIFILAVIFNPYIRASFFARGSPYQSFVNLWRLVSDAYKRLFQTDNAPDYEFRTAFNEYINRKGEYSDDGMSLAYHKEAAIKEKRFVNMINLWRELNPVLGNNLEQTETPPQGKRALVEMAMQIFSATPNSAATERIFSQFGVKHSKHRNRTHAEKIQKEVLLKADTISAYGHPPCRKRKFGEDDDSDNEDDTAPSGLSQTSASATAIGLARAEPTRDPLQLAWIARELIDEASNDVDDADHAPAPAALPSTTPTPAMNRTNLTLKNLFYYPPPSDSSSSSSKALTEYWRAGETGFANEADFHDFMNEDDEN